MVVGSNSVSMFPRDDVRFAGSIGVRLLYLVDAQTKKEKVLCRFPLCYTQKRAEGISSQKNYCKSCKFET